MERIIAISDVHGCLAKLRNLFKKIKPTEEDTIIFLGDYIDRGEDSKGVIDFITKLQKKYNVITLKGNHELFALDSYKAMQGQISKIAMRRSWMMNGGGECLRSYDKESFNSGYENAALEKMFKVHGNFFNNLQLTYETENHIFVHGFLAHEQDVEDQEEWLCLWGRFNDIFPHKSGKVVVCGHTTHEEPVDQGFKVCIDTGSFKRDGCITAMVIGGNKTKFLNSN